MNTRQVWQRDSVKAAFHEVHEFLTAKVSGDTPTSSLDLDVELMGIPPRQQPWTMAWQNAGTASCFRTVTFASPLFLRSKAANLPALLSSKT